MSTTTRMTLWVAIATLFVVGLVSMFAVGGDDGTTEEQAATTTTAPPTGPATTAVMPSTSLAGTGAGMGSPPTTPDQTAAATTSTTASAGSGLGTGGVGDVADGTVPIAETGGQPYAAPGIVALLASVGLLLIRRRACTTV